VSTPDFRRSERVRGGAEAGGGGRAWRPSSGPELRAGARAALVCTPWWTHQDTAPACLERGLPVLCEKPVSLAWPRSTGPRGRPRRTGGGAASHSVTACLSQARPSTHACRVTAHPPRHELAQINIARLLAPLDSPRLADFVAALDPVNAAAEAADGFRWRLRDDEGNATAIRVFDDDWLIVNMSVWRDPEALNSYIYAPEHRAVLARRREWFARPADAMTALWWVPAGHHPTPAEAQHRLTTLRTNGPAPEAFTLRSVFPAPGADADEGAAFDRSMVSPDS
jgi:hypothetical protein